MACGDAYLRFHLEHPGAFRLIASEGNDAVTAKIVAVLDAFRDRIAAAVLAGEAGDHVDPVLTSRVLFGAWNGMIGMGLRQDALRPDDAAISALIEQARRIVVEGLSSPAHRDAAGHSRARLLGIADAES